MWTRAEYDNAATQIGKEFASSNGQMRINDLATKVATENHLNPEGIQTLVRLANVAAFQELFTKRAGSEDRMIEFEVGDPDLVISNIYAETKQAAVAQQKFASVSSYDRAMDYYGPMSVKTAEDESEEEDDDDDEEDDDEEDDDEKEDDKEDGKDKPPFVFGKKVDEPGEESEKALLDKKAMARFNVKRAQEAIDEESRRLMHEWGIALEKAAQSVRVVFGRPNFDKNAFYNDVVADLGVSVIPEIKAIDLLIGGKLGEVANSKLANAPEHTLSSLTNKVETREILSFVKQASEARIKREGYTTSLNWLNEKIAELK
jgi:hypothetical protein